MGREICMKRMDGRERKGETLWTLSKSRGTMHYEKAPPQTFPEKEGATDRL